jgi:hypothetical protein
MAQTLINSDGIASSAITRAKLNTTTAASAVIAKVLAGSGIALTSTGVDAGTGDVTVAMLFPSKSQSANSGALNTTETYISAAYSIAANTLAVGMAFRITAYGTCISTAANLSTFTVRFGTAGTTADATVLAATCTAAVTGTTVPFKFEAIVTIRTIGSTGTVTAGVQIVNNGVTGISSATTPVVVGTGTTLTMNTTVGNFLGLSYKSAATTTTATFNQVIVEQVR